MLETALLRGFAIHGVPCQSEEPCRGWASKMRTEKGLCSTGADRYQEEPPISSHPTTITIKVGGGESRRRGRFSDIW